MTSDGGFRVIATTMRTTVNEAARAQGVSGAVAVRLAELMAGAVLLRETTSPGRRVQISLRDRAGGSLVADTLPDGTTRGLVNPGEDNPAALSGEATMKVTYTMPNGALHTGVVRVEHSNISEALMTYLQESEQILSSLSVAAVGIASPPGGNGVTNGHGSHPLTAAGYVVQLLPELERTPLEAMTDRLSDLEGLGTLLTRDQPTAGDLIERVFEGFEYSILADSQVRFGCNCSRERILSGLATLGRVEIESMIAEAAPLEVRCEACGQSYEIRTAELTTLL
jgi:molecular chaperone Hsp33